MKELKIQPIKNGTVIDHISAGKAFRVLQILGLLQEGTTSVISVAINVPSSMLEKKDIVKIEGKELAPEESDKIAIVAPHATANIIRNYEVVEKHALMVPDELINIIKCPNPSCISNTNEPVPPKFRVISKMPLKVKCYYCEREPDDPERQII
jgi:aspartate carbamoyltransferase regulatory subunit